MTESKTPKKRGRPPKATPQSYKKKKKTFTPNCIQKIRTRWDDRDFALQVDFKNHFVIVEKEIKKKPTCSIQEMDDSHIESQDFRFGASETCPEKSPHPQ